MRERAQDLELTTAEIQGPYGPFTVSERLIQRIWAQQDFLDPQRLKTLSGRPLKVHTPGHWNFEEGPAFREAQLTLNHALLSGDIALQLYAKDWFAHSHHRDPLFNPVVLHTVLFPPRPDERLAYTQRGRRPETLVLLPYLHHDLEAYAHKEAVGSLNWYADPKTMPAWKDLPGPQQKEQLREKALVRWGQKRAYARQRLQSCGWEAACHQMALEGLGYRRNRQPMATLALAFPLESLLGSNKSADELFESQHGRWKLSGLRPANYPKIRLRQYLALLAQRPDWPAALLATLNLLRQKRISEAVSPQLRRRLNFSALRLQFQNTVWAGCLTGSRLDTLIGDVFLPLGSEYLGWDGFPWWFHWYGGDVPEAVKQFLKPILQGAPLGNGWNQGALQLFLEGGVG